MSEHSGKKVFESSQSTGTLLLHYDFSDRRDIFAVGREQGAILQYIYQMVLTDRKS